MTPKSSHRTRNFHLDGDGDGHGSIESANDVSMQYQDVHKMVNHKPQKDMLGLQMIVMIQTKIFHLP